MNTEKITQFQTRLQEEKEKLQKEIHEIAKEDSGGRLPGKHEVRMEDVGSEEGENASEVETYERRLAIQKNLDDQLSRVEVALERIDDGTYGSCAKCKKEIAEKRLDAYPAATTCIDCANN